MGWKAACIITGDCANGYLGEALQHLPAKASDIREKLGYKVPTSREQSSLEPYPESGTYMIGAYDRAVFLADQDKIFDCFDHRDNTYFQKALTLYPEGTLLMFVLHSVVNYFGYAYYEKGQLIREFSGGADKGVISDFGELQPEEKEIFANSKIVDGKRIFLYETDGAVEELEADFMGESLVFQMVGRYFGQPFDQTLEGHRDNFDLPTELFTGPHSERNPIRAAGSGSLLDSAISSIAKFVISKLKR